MSWSFRFRGFTILAAMVAIAASAVINVPCAFVCASASHPTSHKAPVVAHACHQSATASDTVGPDQSCASHAQELSAAPAVPESVVTHTAVSVADRSVARVDHAFSILVATPQIFPASSPPPPRLTALRI